VTHLRPSTGAAPGKVILFGEHAVVYGRPAIAAALERGLGATAEPSADGPRLDIPSWGRNGLHIRLGERQPGIESVARAFAAALEAAGLRDARLRVTLDAELPPGVGLGSSAAFAIALLRALGEFRGAPFDTAGLLKAAESVERVFHGTPSGLDHTVVALGGCLRYQRGATPAFTPVPIAEPVPVVVGWTAREGGTRDVVERLRARHDAHPDLYERLFDAIGEVAEAGVDALARGDLARLGALFDLNHGYLNACGVSALVNEQMVSVARQHGALGAKLTGAGWGGAVIAVAPDHPERIVAALQDAGFSATATRVGASG
jgi:hydroxymethylglutaryl-CoA reductase